MPIFFHSTVLPHDATGFSIWLQEHYLEHAQFVQIFQAKTPTPIFIPDYNFALWGDDKKVMSAWLESHQATHQSLRDFTGVSGIDLSDVDLTQDDQFFDWMDSHAAEHADIRAVLRII
jgi:glycogen debranching enzyme